MKVSQEYAETLSEVYMIINTMEKDLIDQIPNKLLMFIRENKSNKYNPSFNLKKTINKEDLKTETRQFLAYLYYTYWCNEAEKTEYRRILNINENEYQQMIRKKYNPDDIFKERKQRAIENDIEYDQETNLALKEEKWYIRLYNRLKRFSGRNE